MVLNSKDKEEIVKRYSQRYKEFGYHYKTIGWGDWDSQEIRFAVLSEIGYLNGAEIVDVGCGFGDLYNYIANKFVDIKYIGIDIVNDLIIEGKKRYPQAEFLLQDILEDVFFLEADFYFLSGTLNLRLEENVNYSKEMIDKMFRCSRKGTAVNFLSKYVDYECDKDFHYSPEDIFSFSKELTRFVTIRHDYPLWEFTVFLYKEDYIMGKYGR